MSRLNTFMTLILVVILIICFNLQSKVSNLENRLNNLTNSQNQILSAVHSQTGSMMKVINEMKEEQSFITPILFNIVDFRKDEALLKFNWQIKEFNEDSQVLFNYRRNDSDEFTVVEATENANGFFETSLWTSAIIEPQWQVSYGWSSGSQSEKEIRKMETAKEEWHLKNQSSKIDYFISVKDKENTKSSKLNTSHLGNIGSQKYKPIQATLNFDNKTFRINVIEHVFREITQLGFKEVSLKKYAYSNLVLEEKLEVDSTFSDDQIKHYINDRNSPIDFDKLILKIVYENGDVFEKEIYSN